MWACILRGLLVLGPCLKMYYAKAVSLGEAGRCQSRYRSFRSSNLAIVYGEGPVRVSLVLKKSSRYK